MQRMGMHKKHVEMHHALGTPVGVSKALVACRVPQAYISRVPH